MHPALAVVVIHAFVASQTGAPSLLQTVDVVLKEIVIPITQAAVQPVAVLAPELVPYPLPARGWNGARRRRY